MYLVGRGLEDYGIFGEIVWNSDTFCLFYNLGMVVFVEKIIIYFNFINWI